MPVNDDIADALTRHQIGLQRLSNADVRKVVAILRRADTRIAERLLRENLTTIGKARQEKLLKDIRRILKSVYTDATGQMRIQIDALARYEPEFQMDMFKRVVPVNLDFVSPAHDQIMAAVNARPFQYRAGQARPMREWLSGLEPRAFARIRDAIRLGIIDGTTTPEIVRQIRGTSRAGFKDGIAAINKRDAEVVVRTAANHTATVAREGLYKRNSHLIAGVQWSSTLDGRTTLICMSRDGNVYPVDKGPRPPAHPNCRSSTVPILASWRKLGLKGLPGATRASMDGQVPADLTYNDWLRKQPAAFQDEVLGRQKGKLFRAGASVDKFVNRKGVAYTLDELRTREAEAWEKVA